MAEGESVNSFPFEMKKARINAGFTLGKLSKLTGIPSEILSNFEKGYRKPSASAERTILQTLGIIMPESEVIENEIVARYAAVCKQFSHDTSGCDTLKENCCYSTDGSRDWKETTDNAHGGINIAWAFHHDDKYIEFHAGEKLFNELYDFLEFEGISNRNLRKEILRFRDLEYGNKQNYE